MPDSDDELENKLSRLLVTADVNLLTLSLHYALSQINLLHILHF